MRNVELKGGAPSPVTLRSIKIFALDRLVVILSEAKDLADKKQA